MRASGLVVFAWVTTTLAGPEQVLPPISWSAPASCPDRLEVVQQVQRLLPETSSGVSSYLSAIRGTVRLKARHAYQLTLRFETQDGTRERQFDHDDCAKLTEAASLVIAMAIDPEHVRADTNGPKFEELLNNEQQPPVTQSQRELEQLHDSAPKQQERRSSEVRGSRLHWRWAFIGGARAGIVPGWEPTLQTEIGVRPVPTVQLSLVGYYGLPSSILVERTTGAEAMFRTLGLGMVGCWKTGIKLYVGTCAAGEFVGIVGEGRNVANPQTRRDSTTVLWLVLQPGYHLQEGLGVGLDLGLGASLRQPLFSMRGIGQVYRTELLQWRGGAAATVEW